MTSARRLRAVTLLSSSSFAASLVALSVGCGGSTDAPDAGKTDATGDTNIPIVLPPDSGSTVKDSGPKDAGHPDSGKDAGSKDTGADAEEDAGTDAPTFTTVPLTACIPTEYVAPVTIGDQTFQLAIDTGSTSLGVASDKCTNCGVSPSYKPSASAKDQKTTTSSQYGTGSWTGEVYKDEVRIGGSRRTDMGFAAITTQSGFFEAQESCGSMPGPQGIVGLGPPAAAVTGTTGFFEDLVANEGVPNVFATELCTNTGTLWLGGYDPKSVTSPPQYTPMLEMGIDFAYYAVNLSAITVNGVTVPVATTTDGPASLVDTGTSLFILQTPYFDAVTQAIGSNAAFKEVFGFGGGAVDAGAHDAGHDSAVDAGANEAGQTDAGASDATSSADGTVDTGAATVDAATDAGGVNGSSYFSSPENCKILTQTKAELDAMLPPMTLTFGTGPSISVQASATESYLTSYEGYWCPSLYSLPAADIPFASVLGSPVLKSNVVIFDRGNSQIGFAPHPSCD